MLGDKMEKNSWKGEEKDSEIENKKLEDLIQEGQHLIHRSEREFRENEEIKLFLKYKKMFQR